MAAEVEGVQCVFFSFFLQKVKVSECLFLIFNSAQTFVFCKKYWSNYFSFQREKERILSEKISNISQISWNHTCSENTGS